MREYGGDKERSKERSKGAQGSLSWLPRSRLKRLKYPGEAAASI